MAEPAGWTTSERLHRNGTTDSEQRAVVAEPVVPHTPAGAARLGAVYWQDVERFTRGVVRPAPGETAVVLLVTGTRLALLRFGPPERTASADRVGLRYPIAGGLLARRAGGTIALSQARGAPVELRSAIAGFAPRLGARPAAPAWTGRLYTAVQARIHVAISRRYFARLVREAAR
jgi:hypothetical protein